MKNVSKFLMLILMFVPMVQASSIKKIGTKLSSCITVAALMSLTLPKPNQPKVSVPNSLIAKLFEQSINDGQDFFEYYKGACEFRLLCAEEYKNLMLLEDIYPKLYAYCKQLQQRLGLEKVDIKFYFSKTLVPPMRTTPLGCLSKNQKIILDQYFIVQISQFFVEDFLEQKDEFVFGMFKFTLMHELQHVLQFVTQTINGDESKLNEKEALVWNENIYENGSIVQRLMEQVADVVACGDCSCAYCLYELAVGREDYDSAKMTPEGYCVSSRGYLSPEEILKYAQAAIRDGLPLCAEHAAQKDAELILKKIKNMDLSSL